MNWSNIINIATVIGGALLTVLPQLTTALPPGYKDAATAIIAAVVAIYHLFQTPPPNLK